MGDQVKEIELLFLEKSGVTERFGCEKYHYCLVDWMGWAGARRESRESREGRQGQGGEVGHRGWLQAGWREGESGFLAWVAGCIVVPFTVIENCLPRCPCHQALPRELGLASEMQGDVY